MDFHKKLRTLTTPFHGLVDSNFFATSLMGGTLTKEIYISFLQKMYSVHIAVEEKLNSFSDVFDVLEISLAGFNRSKHIETELRNMGVEVDIKEFDASFIKSFFSALAVYYVLEGSKNGALQILPKLKEQLGDGEYKYFAVDENFRAEFMPNIQKIALYALRYKKESEVILAACELYLRLESWLGDSGAN